jgi:hypothetical protein
MARPRTDETGKRYGKWVVVGRATNETDRYLGRWRVRCDCGYEDLRSISTLRSGKSKSCMLCGHKASKERAELTRKKMAPVMKLREEMFDLLKAVRDGKVDAKEAQARVKQANKELRKHRGKS